MTDDDSDAMLDRLDRREPASSKEEAEAREPYERLISRIRELPDENPPDGWESRLEQRWQRKTVGTRRRRRWLAPGVVAALAAALMALGIVAYCRAPSENEGRGGDVVAGPPSLSVLRNGTVVRGDDGIVGDSLKGSGPRTGLATSLRIYRGDTLVAACPGDPGCSNKSERIEIDVPITEPGYYRVMLINGDREPPSTTRGFELDRGELIQAGFTVLVEPLGHDVKR